MNNIFIAKYNCSIEKHTLKCATLLLLNSTINDGYIKKLKLLSVANSITL